MDEEALSLLDQYLGDIIEYVINKFHYDVDLDDEYGDLLSFIYYRLVRAWFKGKRPTLTELETMLQRARKQRRQLEILLSFLISRYVMRQKGAYIRHERQSDHY